MISFFLLLIVHKKTTTADTGKGGGGIRTQRADTNEITLRQPLSLGQSVKRTLIGNLRIDRFLFGSSWDLFPVRWITIFSTGSKESILVVSIFMREPLSPPSSVTKKSSILGAWNLRKSGTMMSLITIIIKTFLKFVFLRKDYNHEFLNKIIQNLISCIIFLFIINIL
jgi:hypothetical protein